MWRKRVARLQRSGKSIRAFATEIGVNANTLAGWKVKLAQGQPSKKSKRRQKQKAQGLSFVDITGALSPQVETDGGEFGRFELLLANGMTVRMPAQFETTGLQRLLDVVEGR